MFEAYSVAVKLSLVNHVSAGLLTISRHLQTTGQDVDKLNAKLTSIGKHAAIGGAMLGGGLAIASLFKAPLEEAKKFDTAVAKFSLFGMSDAVNKEAVSFARGMNFMGSSITQNMKLLTEAQGVFRESGVDSLKALEGAKIAAPILAKIAYATSGLGEESQAKMRTSSLAMLRYIEDSGGLKSAQRFAELANAGWKMTQTSGGSVDWEQLRQFKARAGVAAMNMTDDGVAELEPIITMLKGQTAGFSLRTAYNRLNGIVKIPNQVAHELVNSHIWAGSKITWNKAGGIKSFNGNPFIQSELFSASPVQFYEQYIMPMHKRLGIMSESAIAQSNSMLFGSTGGAMFTLIDKNLEKLHMSLEAQYKAKGLDESVRATDDTFAGKQLQLAQKWKDMMLAVGTVVLPWAITALDKLTPQLVGLSTWIDKNRTGVKLFAGAMLGLSTFLVTGGLINMITAAGQGFGLLFTVLKGGGGITGAVLSGVSFIGKVMMVGLRAIPVIGWVMLAVAAGVYLYRNWDGILTKTKEIWSKVGPYITGAFHWMGSTLSSAWDGIKSGMKSFVGFFLDQWQWLFNKLIGGVNTILPASMQIGKLTFADRWNKSDKLWTAGQPLVTPMLAKAPVLPLLMVPPSTSRAAALPGITSIPDNLRNPVITDLAAARAMSKGASMGAAVAPVPAKQSQTVQVTSTINLDGKKIGEVVTMHQAREASRPRTGTQGFDPTRSMLLPGTPSVAIPRG